MFHARLLSHGQIKIHFLNSLTFLNSLHPPGSLSKKDGISQEQRKQSSVLRSQTPKIHPGNGVFSSVGTVLA